MCHSCYYRLQPVPEVEDVLHRWNLTYYLGVHVRTLDPRQEGFGPLQYFFHGSIAFVSMRSAQCVIPCVLYLCVCFWRCIDPECLSDLFFPLLNCERVDYTPDALEKLIYYRRTSQISSFLREVAFVLTWFNYGAVRGIYIASDSDEALSAFRQTFPTLQVVRHAGACANRSATCVRKALVEAYLLASCGRGFLGSFWSSFSELVELLGGQALGYAGRDFAKPSPPPLPLEIDCDECKVYQERRGTGSPGNILVVYNGPARLPAFVETLWNVSGGAIAPASPLEPLADVQPLSSNETYLHIIARSVQRVADESRAVVAIRTDHFGTWRVGHADVETVMYHLKEHLNFCAVVFLRRHNYLFLHLVSWLTAHSSREAIEGSLPCPPKPISLSLSKPDLLRWFASMDNAFSAVQRQAFRLDYDFFELTFEGHLQRNLTGAAYRLCHALGEDCKYPAQSTRVTRISLDCEDKRRVLRNLDEIKQHFVNTRWEKMLFAE